MSTVLTADAMLAALAKWGITPKFYRQDWREHNRDSVQGFGPIYGFIVHNFGSDGDDQGSLNYLYVGDNARGMPGPLSQFAITDDGQIWVIGWGTANHTGSIGADLLKLVQNDAAPRDHDVRPSTTFSNKTGVLAINDNFIGVEMTYGAAPTPAQRTSLVRLVTAIMDALGPGYTGGSVVGHRECDSQRSDPTGVPMFQLRRDVDALIKAGPSGATTSPAAPSAPAAPPVLEDDMAQQVTIDGGRPNNWNPIVVPNDGKKYRLSLSFAGGAQARKIRVLIFDGVQTVQTPAKVSRDLNFDWQRDVPGAITLEKGEGHISIQWDGTADQKLAAALYPVGTL